MLIKDCCLLQEGYVNPTQSKPNYFDGNIKWLRAIDLNNDYVINTSRTLTQEGYDSAGKSALLFKPDTIAISKSGTIGRIGLLKDYMCGNRAVINIDPDESKVDKMYLFYWLLSHRSIIEKKALGSIQKNLYVSTLGDFDIGDFTLEEQREIVKQINPIFEKVSVNKQLITNLDEYLQLLFHKWFVDFNFPSNNNLPYKASGGEMHEVNGKVIPVGWSVGLLTDLGEIVAGGTPSTENRTYFCKEGIPWLTPKDLALTSYKYIQKGAIDITEEGLKNSSAKLMPKGTVLMSSRAPIGYLAIAKNEITTNQGFKSIVPNTEVGSEFIYYTLKRLMPQIEQMGSGSTFKEVSKEMMTKLSVIIPSETVLKKFQETIRVLSNKLILLEEEIEKLSVIRDLLIKKLIK